MSMDSVEATVTALFKRLRQPFDLGMREYLAALDAVEGGFGRANDEDLKTMLRLLWCSCLAHQAQLDRAWDEVARSARSPVIEQSTAAIESAVEEESRPLIPTRRDEIPAPVEVPITETPRPQLLPLEIRPPLIMGEIDNLPELRTYLPISRRLMQYGWRNLRRLRPDGAADVLDLSATVEQVAKVGFFLSPVYRRRQVNHAQLLLLIDQGGSMTPFHRFSRDLIETAQQDSDLETVAVYYFHNNPITQLYLDSRLTQRADVKELWRKCDRETSVLIVSDGGAARGSYQMERVRQVTEFVVQLQQRTDLIGWLNPMPRERWRGSSADMIAYLVSMKEMSKDGFDQIIEIIRGKRFFSASEGTFSR